MTNLELLFLRLTKHKHYKEISLIQTSIDNIKKCAELVELREETENKFIKIISDTKSNLKEALKAEDADDEINIRISNMLQLVESFEDACVKNKT